MLARIRTAWPRGVVPTGQNLRTLDENTYRAVDGHGGGSYAPSSPITIAGTNGLKLVTKSILKSPGRVFISGTKQITFGKGTPDDAFRYSASHLDTTRILLRNFDEAWSFVGDGPLVINVGNATVETTSPGARFYLPLRTIDGGTITGLTIRWRVGASHAGVPENLPRYRVIRVSAAGLIEPLRAEDSTTDREGWIVWGPRPTSGANYYDTGALKTANYSCNQNNVVDRSTYGYLAEMQDERGTNAFTTNGNFFHSVQTTHTNIARLALRQ